MCKAECDYIFIVRNLKGHQPILKVKCTSTELIVENTIDSKTEDISFMSYLPEFKFLVLIQFHGNAIKAIDCDTGEKVWEITGNKVKGAVEGINWEPHGLFYSTENQTLYVCDKYQLVVLNPSTQSILQMISMPLDGRPLSLSVHENSIIMYHATTSSEKISVFNMK